MNGHVSHPRFKPFDFNRWIDHHRDLLKPPVGNKLVFEEAGMVVMVVGGPNQRVDFHDDPVEEFFYQLEGDMVLKIAEGGRIYDVPIRAGEVFMLASPTCGTRRRGQCRAPSVWSSNRPAPTGCGTVSNGTASDAAAWCTVSMCRSGTSSRICHRCSMRSTRTNRPAPAADAAHFIPAGNHRRTGWPCERP